MAVLVDAQGDMINQIEHYVISAVDHTNKGVDQMKKAVKSQRKSRKKMCCLLFCLLFLIALVSILVSDFHAMPTLAYQMHHPGHCTHKMRAYHLAKEDFILCFFSGRCKQK